MLLDYFGEAGKNCRYCDVCVEKNKREISKDEYQLIKTEILKALENSTYTLTALSEHLSDFSNTRINECIDLMLDENLICYNAQMMLKIYTS
jgi:superfamily II DNA helicase RecQ